MEANVFPLADVRNELGQFVLVRLYTDGDGEIYEGQQTVEQNQFGTVALPSHAIMDSKCRPLGTYPGCT